MCGIAGLVKLNGEEAEIAIGQRMTSELLHRGPDAHSTFAIKNVVLGHTRLAIIDLRPESNQPFHSTCNRFTVVFNGEVFNYVELRAELIKAGHHFRTESDTEVVLVAYAVWGQKCVSRFNGMWALAIYDAREGTLFCSRDRFGVKPFVYAVHKNTFVFASEAKAILAVYPELRTPNYTVISHCMRRGLSASLEQTCFAGIRRLMPAHNLELENGNVRIYRYWDYPKKTVSTQDFRAASEDMRELLSDSVRLRMRSDVPVGVTLSAGIDSTVIATLMRDNSSNSSKAYTSHYPGLDSEATLAAATADSLGFEPVAIPCSADGFVSRLRRIISHIETPHACAPMLPLWEIMSAAKAEVKVMLEGQGADELLAGYLPMFFPFAASQSFRRGKLIAAVTELVTAYKQTSEHALLGSHYFFSNLIRAIYPASHKLIRRFGRGDEDVYIGRLRNCEEYHLPSDGDFDDRLNRRLGAAHSVELLELLHYGDAISMAHGIESRLPFMDFRLVEFIFSQPSHFKLFRGETKRLLRAAFKNDITDAVLKRPKQGFTTPTATWFREGSRDIIEPILFSEKCRNRGLLNASRMRSMVDEHVNGKRDFSSLIFRWITCELWFQEFID